MRSLSSVLVPVPRSRPSEACLDEKADSPDGTQGVGYAGSSNSTDRATLLQMDLSGCRNNRSMADQGRPGCSLPHRRVRHRALEGKHRDKAEAPSHFAWGHRGVRGAHEGLQNYELHVEVGGWRRGATGSFSHGDLRRWAWHEVRRHQNLEQGLELRRQQGQGAQGHSWSVSPFCRLPCFSMRSSWGGF